MTANGESNTGSSPKVSIDVSAEHDEFVFLSLVVTDEASGRDIADVIISDPVEAEQFLDDVKNALTSFRTMKQETPV